MEVAGVGIELNLEEIGIGQRAESYKSVPRCADGPWGFAKFVDSLKKQRN